MELLQEAVLSQRTGVIDTVCNVQDCFSFLHPSSKGIIDQTPGNSEPWGKTRGLFHFTTNIYAAFCVLPSIWEKERKSSDSRNVAKGVITMTALSQCVELMPALADGTSTC